MDRIIYKPKILVRKTKIEKIAKAAGCSEAAVYNAIAFKSNSQAAIDIRNITLSMYGGLLVKKYPELLEE